MPPNKVRPPAGNQGVEEKTPAEVVSSATLPLTADIQNACDVVLVTTPSEKYRRRVFLSLHSATAAVQRAWKKGQPAQLVLCHLVPVTVDLDGRAS